MSQQGQQYKTDDEAMAGMIQPAGGAPAADDLTIEQQPSKPATKAAAPCTVCGAEQSAIRINVDGNTLLMESCDTCDVRRWQLEGERIDLQEALNQVGEHSGRRRPRV